MNRILFNFTPSRLILVTAIFFITFLCIPVAEIRAEVEQQEILVIGTGKVIQGNLAAARKAAVRGRGGEAHDGAGRDRPRRYALCDRCGAPVPGRASGCPRRGRRPATRGLGRPERVHRRCLTRQGPSRVLAPPRSWPAARR